MKYLLSIVLFFSFLYSTDMQDLLKKDKDAYFTYKQKLYHTDDTCTNLDLKKFLTLEDDAILGIKSKNFYLDLCHTYKNLYKMNRKVESGKYQKTETFKDYKEMVAFHKDSFYINFYGYLFLKNTDNIIKDINFEIYDRKEDDYSKYINLWAKRKDHPKFMNKKEDYLLKVFNEGQELLKSTYNVIFTNVANDIRNLLLRDQPEKYLEFMNFWIEENRVRHINNKHLYLELALHFFEKDYKDPKVLNLEFVKDYLEKSYLEGKLPEQEILFVKIKALEFYLDLKKKYPKYLTNIEEHDLIKAKLEVLNEYDKFIPAKYYYLADSRAFLYEKLVYITNTQEVREEFFNNLCLAEKEEPDFKKKAIMKRKIDQIKEGKFFKK